MKLDRQRLGGEGSGILEAFQRDPRRAIQEAAIFCLICGSPFRQLTNTHLRSHHITSLEYKQRYGYNLGRPLMCQALQRLYADRAIRAGLASYIRHRPILSDPELRRRGGYRQISLEERLNRREVQLGRETPAYASARRNGLFAAESSSIPLSAGAGQ